MIFFQFVTLHYLYLEPFLQIDKHKKNITSKGPPQCPVCINRVSILAHKVLGMYTHTQKSECPQAPTFFFHLVTNEMTFLQENKVLAIPISRLSTIALIASDLAFRIEAVFLKDSNLKVSSNNFVISRFVSVRGRKLY